jgi:uncharacterized protein YdhG (YjbR/CyaY superfamily)
MEKPKSVDAYLRGMPPDARRTLEVLRSSIKACSPDADESIAYGMPAYKYRGKSLVYFAASKNHCGLYGPAVVDHQDLLRDYDTSKGAVRFPIGKPLPKRIVNALLKARMAEIDAAARIKRKK